MRFMGSTPISTEKTEVQGLRSQAQLYPNSDQAETQTQGFFLPKALPSAVKCPWGFQESRQVALPLTLGLSSLTPPYTSVGHRQMPV